MVSGLTAIRKNRSYALNETMIPESEEFFRHEPLQEFHLDADRCRFQARSVSVPRKQHGLLYLLPPKEPIGSGNRGAAAVECGQPGAHGALPMLARLGYGVLRLTLPYHEERNPHGPRADFMSAPIWDVRFQAIQQSVQLRVVQRTGCFLKDTRGLALWQQRGIVHQLSCLFA